MTTNYEKYFGDASRAAVSGEEQDVPRYRQGHGEPVGEIGGREMSEFYRFPAMANLGEWTSDLQAEKVCEEAQELAEASARGSAYYEDDFEAMDVIHSAENYLRIKGHSDETLGMLQSLVIEKNRKRGYYDER